MDVNAAKTAFKNILDSLSNENRSEFLSWCEEKFTDANFSNSYFELRVIAEDIKSMIPTEAIFPSETINHTQILNNSISSPILHVDSFLFEEEHVDVLEHEGKLKRNYCQKCGSLDVLPITFISHSISIKNIEHIFRNMLPDLSGKVFLDVGSRLGAMLYGAYYCSSAQKIIGVEMNEDFCKLQKFIVEKYSLNDRIQIICNDICNLPEIIQSANVITLYNVFECFFPVEIQQRIWIWLRNTMTIPGTIIVTYPSIEKTLINLQTGIDVSSWLRKISVENSGIEDTDDPNSLDEICSYIVL